MRIIKFLLVAAALHTMPFAMFAQEKIDLAIVKKITDEEMERSKVMDIAFHLTDVSGPRLTISPGFKRAADYAVSKLKEWGLANAQLDPWGTFGKGWEIERSYVAMKTPYYKSLIAVPKAWTGGTNGLQINNVLVISARDSAELQGYKGNLRGKILIMDRNDIYSQSFEADAKRYTAADLEKMAESKPAERAGGDSATLARRREQFTAMRASNAVGVLLKAMAEKEGATAMMSASTRGHDGTLFVQGGGGFKVSDPENFLDIVLANEDYMTLLRLAKSGIPVSMEMDVKTKFTTDDLNGYNVIAEIPGTDKNLKNEVVMLGGHLDSWHGASGATDNAAGCSIMLEAVRLLQTLGLKPRRTIRIALWSGEEEGLFGSRGYVKKTFADPATMKLLPAHEKLAAYFNLDNGTGKIRGIYLQGNDAVMPVFTEWLKPFNDMGAKTVTINNTGGTDHLSFDAAGLPGFQFIQDEIEYNTRTHHTNMDTFDHLIEADLKQASAVVASFIYNAAQRDEKLPRKELPKANPNSRGY